MRLRYISEVLSGLSLLCAYLPAHASSDEAVIDSWISTCRGDERVRNVLSTNAATRKSWRGLRIIGETGADIVGEFGVTLVIDGTPEEINQRLAELKALKRRRHPECAVPMQRSVRKNGSSTGINCYCERRKGSEHAED